VGYLSISFTRGRNLSLFLAFSIIVSYEISFTSPLTLMKNPGGKMENPSSLCTEGLKSATKEHTASFDVPFNCL